MLGPKVFALSCRRRHADVVEWAWFVNSYGDNGIYQQLMNGDKDSFLLAFALANKITEYYQVIMNDEHRKSALWALLLHAIIHLHLASGVIKLVSELAKHTAVYHLPIVGFTHCHCCSR